MIHDEILHKWINKTISTEELEQFRQRPEYEELVQLYDRTDDLQPPTFDTNEMLANILAAEKKEVVAEKPQTKVVAFPNWAKLAIAAALIGLVALFFFPFNNEVEIITAKEKTQEITLPDGSEITLFGNSFISYQGKNWQEKREVELVGEAKFDVEEGVPFSVITTMGNVNVLGTIFTVDTRNQELSVECNEGRVAVSSPDEKFLEMIAPNESVRMTAIEMMVKKRNLTTFKNVDLHHIIKEISSKFDDVKFDVKQADLTVRLNGNFQHENLEKALKTAIGSINYTVKGKTVILK